MSDLLKEAIADAKAVRETALQNAKMALEEAFSPQLKSMLTAKLKEDEYEDEEEMAADEFGGDEEEEEIPAEEGTYEDEGINPNDEGNAQEAWNQSSCEKPKPYEETDWSSPQIPQSRFKDLDWPGDRTTQ